VLARAAPELAGQGYRVALAGCACVRDPNVPVGAEHVTVTDPGG
jgi:hypothetical protein